MGGGVNRLCPYLCSSTAKRESQETHKREKGEWKQSQVQDNDKVKCALNGWAQSQRDKGQPADKVCAAEGNGRSGKALGIGPPLLPYLRELQASSTTCWTDEQTRQCSVSDSSCSSDESKREKLTKKKFKFYLSGWAVKCFLWMLQRCRREFDFIRHSLVYHGLASAVQCCVMTAAWEAFKTKTNQKQCWLERHVASALNSYFLEQLQQKPTAWLEDFLSCFDV